MDHKGRYLDSKHAQVVNNGGFILEASAAVSPRLQVDAGWKSSTARSAVFFGARIASKQAPIPRSNSDHVSVSSGLTQCQARKQLKTTQCIAGEYVFLWRRVHERLEVASLTSEGRC